MNKISIDKKYKTRSGFPVRIYAVDCGGALSVHGAYFYNNDEWFPISYTKNGRLVDNSIEHSLDLIEVSKYDHIKIDDKVLVWMDFIEQIKRYFAGIGKDGKPRTWDEGKTAFTISENYTNEWLSTAWDNCELFKESTRR